jgi:peptide/nickel transport system permease protein
MSKRRSSVKEIWSRFSKNKMAMAGAAVLSFLIFIALGADFISPQAPDAQDLLASLEKPSLKWPLGTDEFGRDILSRLIYGARVSLMVGILAVGIGMFFGGAIGAIAGFYGSLVDNILMRGMDILLSIPSTLLAIAIAASLGPGLFNLMVAVGISSIPRYARILRGSALSIRNQEYIEAARAVGSSDLRVILRHVIPNSMAPVIVQATLGVASAILNTAGLSFIGLGIQPPTPEWGAMLSSGRTYIRDFPHLTIFPGLAIMTTILALNFLGDGLRDALDPKLKR